MMKKFFGCAAIVLAAAAILFGCGTSPQPRGGNVFSRPGTYTAVRQGVFKVPMTIKVTVDRSSILAIDVWHHETFGYGDVAISTLKSEILATQSLAVDTISSASVSSAAFLSGVESALTDAGGNMDRLKAKKNGARYQDETVDVVVVGGGTAGIQAALTAHQLGAKTILIEKEGTLGGNTLRASVSVGGYGADIQKGIGLDTNTRFRNVTASVTDPIERLKQGVLVYNSKYAIDRAVRGGADFEAISGGVQVPSRVPPGPELIRGLEKTMGEEGLEYRLKHRGTELVVDPANPKKVTGIVVQVNGGETYTITVNKGVILATGGFTSPRPANQAFKDQYLPPPWNTVPTTNSPGLEGDGQKMAIKIGADLKELEAKETFTANPSALAVNGSYISLSGLRTEGPVYVDTTGNRFASENDVAYGDSKKAIQGTVNAGAYAASQWQNYENSPISKVLAKSGGYWMITDQNVVDYLGSVRYYYQQGLFARGNTWGELADALNARPEMGKLSAAEKAAFKTNLEATMKGIKDWADSRPAAFEDNLHAPYRAAALQRWGNAGYNGFTTRPPYYAAWVTLAIHSSGGGITTNEKTEVLHKDGTVISGLYAVGTTANSSMQSGATVPPAGAWGVAAGRVINGLEPYDANGHAKVK